MAFAGWALEDGTPVFIDGAPLIAHADPQNPEINVLAVFIEVHTNAAADTDGEPDTPADAPETASDDAEGEPDTFVGTPEMASADPTDDTEEDADTPVGTPKMASADPANDAEGEPTDDKTDAEQDATEADEPAKASLSEGGGATAPEGVVPFSQSALCDGVIVTVRADAGTFPASAMLSVTKVLLDEQGLAEAAVDEVRDDDQNVAARYTFDIRVLDAEGVELQPAEGRTVQVSFAMAEVADENLETNVYHIADDMTAEKLDVTAEDATTAVVETEGFSLYTVELTYNTLQYVLEGGASVPLWEITTAVGLQGEPTGVCISDERLFCAAYEDGAWVIHSLQPFRTEEWMRVEIGGSTFTITVTDATGPVTYLDENGNTQTRNDVTFVSKNSTSWNDGWYAVTENTTIINRVTVTGNVNLILCDGATLTAEEGITVSEGNSLTVRAQGGGTGALYAGTADGDHATCERGCAGASPATPQAPAAAGCSCSAWRTPAARSRCPAARSPATRQPGAAAACTSMSMRASPSPARPTSPGIPGTGPGRTTSTCTGTASSPWRAN